MAENEEPALLGVPMPQPVWTDPPERRPEVDEEGCCRACRGTGLVAVGPFGVRPPRVKCDACGGSGWATA